MATDPLAPGQSTRQVAIPEQTAETIERRLEPTEFESVDAYVAFALEQLLRELDRSDDRNSPAEPSDSDPADDTRGSESGPEEATADQTSHRPVDEAVHERLDSLGYQ